MKLKSIEELKDGMWCRLASGEVYTHDGQVYRRGIYVRSYVRALIDMGAKWYPKIPDGYRLATEGDRKAGGFVEGRRFAWGGEWLHITSMDGSWYPDCEYIVPEKQEPKVYTVEKWCLSDTYPSIVFRGNDFQPGDRVRVEKVEG